MFVPELDPPETQPTPPARSQSALRALVLRLHFYAGVFVGPFLLVAAITGGLYAIAPTLEKTVYRDLLDVAPAEQTLPLNEQVTVASATHPDLATVGLRPAAHPDESTRVYFADATLGEDRTLAVFVNPHNGDVLGEQPVWFGYLPLSTWLDGLHRHLHLGEPGRVYSELAASWLWIIALGGIYLWALRVRSARRQGRSARLLAVERRVTGRPRTRNSHAVIGSWLLVMLLFLSATGITWSTYAGQHVTELRSQLNWQRPQIDTELGGHGAHSGGGEHGSLGSIDYDGVVASAERAGVQAPLEVSLPEEAGDGVTVTEIDKPYRLTTDVASVDPATLAVTSTIDYWREYSVAAMLADWGIRMHMGFLFGLANQLMLLAVALGAVTAIVLGYRMWWQRRPTRGTVWSVGRPPAGGALRRLPVWSAVAIIAAAVATGWFLPVLGWTLAAFVVADLTAGAVGARRAGRRDDRS